MNVFVYFCCFVSVVFYLFLFELFRNKVRIKIIFLKGVLIIAGYRLWIGYLVEGIWYEDR